MIIGAGIVKKRQGMVEILVPEKLYHFLRSKPETEVAIQRHRCPPNEPG